MLVLLFTMSRANRPSSDIIEKYADSSLSQQSEITIADILGAQNRIDIEENIDDISSGLVLYTTAFNNRSYGGNGKSWINIAKKKTQTATTTPPPAPTDSTTCKTEAKSLDFDMSPVFSRKTGFFLGSNRLVGPFSNSTNIQFHNTYTIVLVVKHGNLIINDNDKEIELLKMYANSPNNNGLSMYIRAGSLQDINNVQMGSLMFQYADMQPMMCLKAQQDTLMNLDKDELMFYFIIKDIDHVKVVYMSEKTNDVKTLRTIDISHNDINFSNKEMVINRMVNWNANLFNVAFYNFALSDQDVPAFYNHVMDEYMKSNDPSFSKVLSKYNTTLDYLTNLLKCPYDTATCNACSTITNWLDPNQLMMASAECKAAVNSSCSTNSKEMMCKCWDRAAAIYNTESCRMYRSIFDKDDGGFLKFLTVADLEFIKKKYKLIAVDECPRHLDKHELLKNEYSEYDLAKLKVDGIPGAKPTMPKLDKEGTTCANGKPIDKEAEKLMVKRPSDDINTMTDFYNKDPNYIDEPTKKVNAVRDMTEREQIKERERNSHLRIGQSLREIQFDAPLASEYSGKEAASMGDIATSNPDNFFTRFLKIMSPSSK